MKKFNLKVPHLKNDFSPPKKIKQYLGMACFFLMCFLQPCLTNAQTFTGTTGPTSAKPLVRILYVPSLCRTLAR